MTVSVRVSDGVSSGEFASVFAFQDVIRVLLVSLGVGDGVGDGSFMMRTTVRVVKRCPSVGVTVCVGFR